MAKLRVIPTTDATLRRGHSVEAFKLCPLCTSLNVRENDECFVCRWSGEFDCNPAAIEMSLYELRKQRAGGLHAIEVYVQPTRRSPWQSFKSWLRNLRRRAIDIQA